MEKKSIGSFIAALRKSNGMTQQDVADRLNVSNKTVSKWERDESYPEITLIPVIAELFNVTSDEILRGERINKDKSEASEVKTDIKIDKQIKRIVNSSITKFKNISYIAIALCFVGLTCLFTISYAFYRPVIAFGVFLLFIIASIVLELIVLNISSTAIKVNDIFEDRREQFIPAQNTRNLYAFTVIIIDVTAVIFALPFILIQDDYYTNSVITADSYLALVPLLFIASWIIYKISYGFLIKNLIKMEDITKELFPRKKMSNMNTFHYFVIAAVYLLIIFSSFGIVSETMGYANGQLVSHSRTFSPLAVFLPFIFILFIMFVYMIRGKNPKEKLLFFLAGLRNFLFGFIGINYLVLFKKDVIGVSQFSVMVYIIIVISIAVAIMYEILKNKFYNQPSRYKL